MSRHRKGRLLVTLCAAVAMTRVSAMQQNVRDQRRRDHDALERLEIIIAERQEIAKIAAERVADALAAKWDVRDGLCNAEQALRDIQRMERLIR